MSVGGMIIKLIRGWSPQAVFWFHIEIQHIKTPGFHFFLGTLTFYAISLCNRC